MSKKGAPWTPEEEADLIGGLKSGKSFESLARIHQRSIKAVQFRWGLFCKKLIQQGKDPLVLSNEFGVDPSFLDQILMELSEKPSASIELPSSSRHNHNGCACKEDLALISEKIEKQYRLIKKVLERQEKILEEISLLRKKSLKKESRDIKK